MMDKAFYEKFAGTAAWIGVDFDGTLATRTSGSHLEVGHPIDLMVKRVNQWLQMGVRVKIVTARMSLHPVHDKQELMLQAQALHDFCMTYFGVKLELTCSKDFNMVELWDDRAVTVKFNTGQILGRNRR